MKVPTYVLFVVSPMNVLLNYLLVCPIYSPKDKAQADTARSGVRSLSGLDLQEVLSQQLSAIP